MFGDEDEDGEQGEAAASDGDEDEDVELYAEEEGEELYDEEEEGGEDGGAEEQGTSRYVVGGGKCRFSAESIDLRQVLHFSKIPLITDISSLTLYQCRPTVCSHPPALPSHPLRRRIWTTNPPSRCGTAASPSPK